MASVRSLQARVQIADAAPELRRARAHAVGGDAAWRRRLQRYGRGETVIVALTAFAMIDGEQPELWCFCHDVLWIDRPITQGALHDRMRDRAHRDFRAVGPRLRDRGIQLSAGHDSIAVELRVDSTVAEYLDGPGNASRASRRETCQDPS